MNRSGFVFALSALVLVVSAATKSEPTSTNTTALPTSSLPTITTISPDSNANKTKEEIGQGRGYGRRNDYGDKHNRHGHDHRRRHDSSSEEGYGYDLHPYSRVKPYYDTHYCSVHGSFRLAYNEKVEKKENGGQQQYDQQQYGNGGQQQYDQQQYGGNQGGYGNGGQQYDQQQYGGNQGGYGKPSNGYGDRSSYKDKPHYVRKITRQYCRYAAAWSEKACKFCCKVVARSAYTNPDDIIAAIFSFDPAHPGSGGAGVEKYGHKDEKYGHKDKYQSNEYGGQGGYENQGGYNNQGGNYGGNSYGGQQQQNYSPPQYGSGPYRAKRNSGYSPAPSYGPSAPAQSYDNQYQQPDQYQQGGNDQYSATPDAYSTKPDNGNKYENESEGKPINQCVCCAPKHRYY